MRLCFWEDGCERDLAPLTLTRPSFEVVCGRFSLRERLLRAWKIQEWGAILRPHLVASYRETDPYAHLNDYSWFSEEPILVINGRWIPEDLTQWPCQPEEAVFYEDQLLAFWVCPGEWDGGCEIESIAESRQRVDRAGLLIERPWDLVEENARQLERDYALATDPSLPVRKRKVELIGPERWLSVAPTAEIEPFVVIDTRNGPVTIEEGVKVKSFTRLEGPCHLGRATEVFRAQISAGSTIGPVCRIGGEVENSIVHSHANKYHDGFLGHSYICPWVNIGAQSGTSDLKFDYSGVRVPLSGEMVETNLTKVGSFIGDHTKIAVNSLFDTGTSVGVMAAVLPDGDLLPRHIPSFSRYWRGDLSEGWPLDRWFEVARIAMSRRNCELTAAQEMLYRLIYDQTAKERERAIDRRCGRSLGENPSGESRVA